MGNHFVLYNKFLNFHFLDLYVMVYIIGHFYRIQISYKLHSITRQPLNNYLVAYFHHQLTLCCLGNRGDWQFGNKREREGKKNKWDLNFGHSFIYFLRRGGKAHRFISQ